LTSFARSRVRIRGEGHDVFQCHIRHPVGLSIDQIEPILTVMMQQMVTQVFSVNERKATLVTLAYETKCGVVFAVGDTMDIVGLRWMTLFSVARTWKSLVTT